MQEKWAYIGGEQRVDVRICENETREREMVESLSRSVLPLCRNTCRPHGEATSSDGAIERALLSAYEHLGNSKGSVQMSTWLTAIALLIVGSDCAEAPAVSTKTPIQN
jgi:hypothetical protein